MPSIISLPLGEVKSWKTQESGSEKIVKAGPTPPCGGVPVRSGIKAGRRHLGEPGRPGVGRVPNI